MAKKVRAKAPIARAAAAVASPQAAEATTVSIWDDDPESGRLVDVPVPTLPGSPLALAFSLPAPAPPGTYQTGTPEFRYWVAAAALRRCAEFWAAHVPGISWQPGATLNVILDEDEDLNAYYDRAALNFFHGVGQGGATVYSGESPDILAHEMGHAILDAIKPQLWDAASLEQPAFHESFGDMSAMLTALQLPSFRTSVLSETNGRIGANSRLSRLACQLGTAIRLQSPDAVDPDCLRNAANSFAYVDPINLPSMAPASQISSEPHSFSRIFTGAFLDILAGLAKVKAATPALPTPDELLAVSGEIADILVAGIGTAPVVPNFYASVAAAMVEASAKVNANYPAILKAAFVRRSILSLSSASSLHAIQPSIAAIAPRSTDLGPAAPLAKVALSAEDYGFDRPLVVETASHNRLFVPRAAATQGIGSVEPANSATSAVAFVEYIFGRGHVDQSAVTGKYVSPGTGRQTHVVVREGEGYHLKRRHFDCGFCRPDW